MNKEIGNPNLNKHIYTTTDVASISEFCDGVSIENEAVRGLMHNYSLMELGRERLENSPYFIHIPSNILIRLQEMNQKHPEPKETVRIIKNAATKRPTGPYYIEETAQMTLSYGVLSFSDRKIIEGYSTTPEERQELMDYAIKITEVFPESVAKFLKTKPKEIRDSLLSKLNTIH